MKFEPKISDHALVRYATRVAGIDMEAMRQKLLAGDVGYALRMGAKRVTIGGITFRADKGVLITVIEEPETQAARAAAIEAKRAAR